MNKKETTKSNKPTIAHSKRLTRNCRTTATFG